VLKQVR